MAVHVEAIGPVTLVTIDRPPQRNAVDGPTAVELAEAFRAFDADDSASVAILTGAGGTFCAGADLKAIAAGTGNRIDVSIDVDGPMGPTRMLLDKPVIAAIEGYAVAGGLELALWCDLRVAARDAVFGVFCRRWGVPLVDGGTVRLPRLIGHSRALDMILTGRGVDGDEALAMGLANRLTDPGAALDGARRAGAGDRRPPAAVPAQRPALQLRAVAPRRAGRAPTRGGARHREPAHRRVRRWREALRRRRGPPRREGVGAGRQPRPGERAVLPLSGGELHRHVDSSTRVSRRQRRRRRHWRREGGRLRHQDDAAEGLTALDVAVGVGRLGQREGPIDHDP